MIDKSVSTLNEAIVRIHDGATIMIGGFGPTGQPTFLINALVDQSARDLTIINNNAGNGEVGLATLLKAGRVRKMIYSFPRQMDSQIFGDLYRRSRMELGLAPQGSLAARIQVAGAGLGAVFTPTGYGTPLTEDKETREIGGRHHILEYPIKADLALAKAHQGDCWNNLVYRKAARNFGLVTATAVKITIIEVSQLVPLDDLDPEHIITPDIFVQRVFSLENLTAAQHT